MRPGAILLTATLIGGTPIATLCLLAAIGVAEPGPVLVAILLIGLVAFGLAMLWARDLGMLADTVRRAAAEGMAEPSLLTGTPVLPAVERIGRDIERLSRSMAARTGMVARLRRADEAIVERLPDPVIVLGADGAVRRANTAARAAYGTDMPAVLRHPGLRAAVDRATRDPAPSSIGAIKPISQTADLTLPVPIPREVRATVVLLDATLHDGGEIVVVLSDRTRERVIERTRADFVANASHELRTPLASLSGFIDTLLGPAADDVPAQRRFLPIMAEQAARMSRLIDDLLNLSRIELTEHQPPSDRIALAPLLAGWVAAFEPRIAERRATLVLDAPDSVPPVLGDADQLAQVVQNLIENALKYGRDGMTLRVTLAPAPAPATGGSWPARAGIVLSVADQGVGIPRQHLPRLTERFYRVDPSRSRAVFGTGLGLAIVKHVANRHRGQLLIESEEGVGTTVSLWLPRASSLTLGPTPGPIPAGAGAAEVAALAADKP